MMKRAACVRRGGVCLLVLLIMLPVCARGQSFRIRPHLDVSETFEDNIFLTKGDKEADFYTTLTPGLSLRIPTRWIDLNVDYSFLAYIYARHSRLNRYLHELDFSVSEEPIRFRNFTVRAGDSFSTVPLHLGVPEDEPSNLVQRNVLWIEPAWRKKLSERSYVEIGYRFNRADYVDVDDFSPDAGEPYFGHGFFTEVRRDFSPRFSLFQRNELTFRNYDNIGDYAAFSPMVGMSAEPLRRLRVSLSGGPQWSQYEGTTSGYRVNAGAFYRFTKRIELEAGYWRRETVDIEGGLFTEDSVRMGAAYRLGPRTRLWGYGSYSRFDSVGGDDHDKFITLGGGLDYRLTRRLYLRAGYLHFYNPGDLGYTNNRTFMGFNYAF